LKTLDLEGYSRVVEYASSFIGYLPNIENVSIHVECPEMKHPYSQTDLTAKLKGLLTDSVKFMGKPDIFKKMALRDEPVYLVACLTGKTVNPDGNETPFEIFATSETFNYAGLRANNMRKNVAAKYDKESGQIIKDSRASTAKHPKASPGDMNLKPVFNGLAIPQAECNHLTPVPPPFPSDRPDFNQRNKSSFKRPKRTREEAKDVNIGEESRIPVAIHIPDAEVTKKSVDAKDSTYDSDSSEHNSDWDPIAGNARIELESESKSKSKSESEYKSESETESEP
jgi:hypothetical protein